MLHPAPTCEEKDILRQVADGDQRAFRQLFDLYHNKLGAHIYHITKSRELAEEVVQDVFLKIWKNRTSLGDLNNFKSYLFVISRNHALNCLKTAAAKHFTINNLEQVSDEMPIADLFEENERYLLVDEAIDRLPQQQKQVYLLSRHERLQYAEIAERMSLSRETVKKYLQISTESITSYVRKRLTISAILFISNLF
ncbi:MAG TPA: RNA polymerase sigma-70 factor [Dyadobacter sp.]|jgi:RNA polymerase sigma-70 factor (ECF subfamily)|nr:RNA polymerase sigma-70 factor [Dyadobacter sp.]